MLAIPKFPDTDILYSLDSDTCEPIVFNWFSAMNNVYSFCTLMLGPRKSACSSSSSKISGVLFDNNAIQGNAGSTSRIAGLMDLS